MNWCVRIEVWHTDNTSHDPDESFLIGVWRNLPDAEKAQATMTGFLSRWRASDVIGQVTATTEPLHNHHLTDVDKVMADIVNDWTGVRA